MGRQQEPLPGIKFLKCSGLAPPVKAVDCVLRCPREARLIRPEGGWLTGQEAVLKESHAGGRLTSTGALGGCGCQMLLSMKVASCDLDSAPTFVASTSPFLNNISVGMPRMPYFGGVS